MKNLKVLGLTEISVIALMALALMGAGADRAWATALEVGGIAKNSAIEITASLKSGTKLHLKDTAGLSRGECSTSHLTGNSSSPFVGASVTGPVSSLSFENCARPITVHAPGKLEITWIPGTTNGTVASEEAVMTVGTAIGTITCDTGATTTIGTLTGVASGEATMDINAVLNCGVIPSAKWEGTFSVTSPAGFGVSSALPETSLELGGNRTSEAASLTASLKGLLTVEDTTGLGQNACDTSHLTATTSSPFTGSSVTAPISAMSFENCTRPVTVHAPGSLELEHIGGSTNGTVNFENVQVTMGSPVGTLNCTTGATKHVGTLTGVASGEATIDVNAVLNCGIVPSARWTATYAVTSPAGLGVTEAGPTSALEVGGVKKAESVEVTMSLKASTSLTLKDTAGFSKNQCSASHVSASTGSPFVGGAVTGPVAALTFEGCTRPVTVHAPGKLEFVRSSGTNATVASEQAQVTFGSSIGTLNCTTGSTTQLGTLTGVKEGHATMDVNAVLNCGIVPSAKFEATYVVTSPTGLGVTS